MVVMDPGVPSRQVLFVFVRKPVEHICTIWMWHIGDRCHCAVWAFCHGITHLNSYWHEIILSLCYLGWQTVGFASSMSLLELCRHDLLYSCPGCGSLRGICSIYHCPCRWRQSTICVCNLSLKSPTLWKMSGLYWLCEKCQDYSSDSSDSFHKVSDFNK